MHRSFHQRMAVVVDESWALVRSKKSQWHFAEVGVVIAPAGVGPKRRATELTASSPAAIAL